MGVSKLTVSEREKVIELYLSGKASQEIGEIFNYTDAGIRHVLRTMGVKIRDKYQSHRDFNLDENFFERIDSHDKAQILGMYAADGCVHGNYLAISLVKKDIEYIKWIKNNLKYTKKIHFKHDKRKNRQGMAELKIGCKKLVSDIQKLGIVERKSLTLGFPTYEQIPKQFIPSYVLGYFEGDGCVTFNDKSGTAGINICGTKEFCDTLSNILREELNIKPNVYLHHKERPVVNAFVLSFGGRKQVVKFLDWIYKDSNFHLERKYKKYIHLRNQYDSNGVHKNTGIGENCKSSKLNNEKVLEIRQLLKTGESLAKIGERFNVTSSNIFSIKNGKTWKHLK